MGEHKIDDTFNPASREYDYFKCPELTMGGDKPPLLEMIVALNLESTYFNQITQTFEPFIEPWNLDVHLS